MTKLLLDSGDIREYREIASLAKNNNSEIWGATTNPTLIAKTLSGKKLSQKEAIELQKEIIMEILEIVPGAVSAEVYADEGTAGEEMVAQGEEIATWGERVYIKLPTTIEGFKARTTLRQKNIQINNTLVFSQPQILAITLHEQIMKDANTQNKNNWPPFISPFVGRLDDKGKNGMQLIENGLKITNQFKSSGKSLAWILASSIRTPEHMKRCFSLDVDLITAPASALKEWFMLTVDQKEEIDTSVANKALADIPYWQPSKELLEIKTIEGFNRALESKTLDISNDLTDAGLRKFARDWKNIIAG
jgi:transaldolase